MTTPDIDISTKCEDWPRVDALIHKVIGKLFEIHPLGSDEAEISIVLADNDFVQSLNKDWRKQDKPTNVLSFPQGHPGVLGDVILALETIQSEAIAQNKSFEDHAAHLIAHGALHLLGFDHETENEAEEMEALEIKILGEIGIKNPYLFTASMS